MNFVKLLVRIAYDYSNVLGELALYGILHFACIITPTFIKNQGWGHRQYNPMIPVKTRMETVTTINHQNQKAVKNNVKTASKQASRKKIQVKAKIAKPEQENDAIKS